MIDRCEQNVTIGNYGQYISDYNLCGYSKSTLKAEKECLKFSQTLVPIIDGRNAMLGEAPWVVSIEGRRDATFLEILKNLRTEVYVTFDTIIYN